MVKVYYNGIDNCIAIDYYDTMKEFENCISKYKDKEILDILLFSKKGYFIKGIDIEKVGK